MKELHVQAAHLTAMTMDAIFAQTVALVNGQPTRGRSGDVCLVLGSVKFIDPYGLVGLCGVLRYLARRFRTLLVVPPVERDLQAT